MRVQPTMGIGLGRLPAGALQPAEAVDVCAEREFPKRKLCRD